MMLMFRGTFETALTGFVAVRVGARASAAEPVCKTPDEISAHGDAGEVGSAGCDHGGELRVSQKSGSWREDRRLARCVLSAARESPYGRKNGCIACRIVCDSAWYGRPATGHLQRKRSCRSDRGSAHRKVKNCGDFLIDGDILCGRWQES